MLSCVPDLRFSASLARAPHRHEQVAVRRPPTSRMAGRGGARIPDDQGHVPPGVGVPSGEPRIVQKNESKAVTSRRSTRRGSDVTSSRDQQAEGAAGVRGAPPQGPDLEGLGEVLSQVRPQGPSPPRVPSVIPAVSLRSSPAPGPPPSGSSGHGGPVTHPCTLLAPGRSTILKPSLVRRSGWERGRVTKERREVPHSCSGGVHSNHTIMYSRPQRPEVTPPPHDGALCGEHQRGDGGGVLQGRPGDLGRVDDPGLTMSTHSPVEASKPRLPRSARIRSTTTAPSYPAFVGDQLGRLGQRVADDPGPVASSPSRSSFSRPAASSGSR